MNQPVAHYSDGRNAWNVGFVGFLIRARGIALTMFVTLVSMGAPWWWPERVPSTFEISLKALAVLSALIIGGMFVATLFYLRQRTRRSLTMKYLLHKMVHDVRDRQSALHQKLAPGKGFSKGKLVKELELLLAEVCENASSYFRELIGDNTISVAIRIAVTDTQEGMVVYRTFARSKGLNSNRAKTSEPIPANQGIPRFLRDEKNSQGILIYYDLPAAAQSGAYQLTKNDQIYPHDISTMMVAPLNAWSGTKQDMLGIMYVTSREGGAFHVKHVDSMAFVADHVASAISNAIQLVSFKCSTIGLRGGIANA